MEKHTWRKATTLSQNTPSARWGHASTLVDRHLVLFGGYAGPSPNIQTHNTGTIYGPTIQPPWFGPKYKHKGKSRPYAPMPHCTSIPKENNWSSSEEADRTNQDTTMSASSTGRPKIGRDSSPPREKIPPGKEPTTAHNSSTPISSYSAEKASQTLKICGRSTFSNLDGGK